MENKALPLPDFSVRRIKALNLFINESGLTNDMVFRVDLNHAFNANLETKLVALDIEVVFKLNENNQERVILDCTVQNIFEIPNLSAYLDGENSISLPQETIVSFVSLSVSHTRAVMSTLTGGTFFQDNLLQVINPFELAKIFFPDSNPNSKLTPEEKQDFESIDLAPMNNQSPKVVLTDILNKKIKKGQK